MASKTKNGYLGRMQTYQRHTLFWIIIYLLWTYMKSRHIIGSPFLIINLLNVAIYMVAFYTLKHIQIPKLYQKGKYVYFILSIVVMSIIMHVVWRLNCLYWVDDLRGYSYPETFFETADYLTQSVQFYSPAVLLIAWEAHIDRRKEQERIQQLEKEKLSTELKFLKAQLNPHFLFNTLNNLYSYVVNGSPKAPDMVLRLSGILDYVLYKSQQASVTLKEELEAIENFLALEKIRYGDRLEVIYSNKGNTSARVSPLLLLSIVENAFKHGASGDVESPKIKITIEEEDDKIYCSVWNTKSKHQGELNDEYKEGIGLSNIKRQLNLVYPNNHKLQIDDKPDSFDLSLNLSPYHE